MQEAIGFQLIPVLDDLAKKLLPTINFIGEWIQKNPELTKNILLGATAVAALSASILILSPIVSTIATVIGIATIAIK